MNFSNRNKQTGFLKYKKNIKLDMVSPKENNEYICKSVII